MVKLTRQMVFGAAHLTMLPTISIAIMQALMIKEYLFLAPLLFMLLL
jgi:hypothetical protein